MNIITTIYAIVTYDENGNEIIMTNEDSAPMVATNIDGIISFYPIALHTAFGTGKEFRVLSYAHRKEIPKSFFED